MKNIISAFTTLFFYLLCVFGAAALLTASAQTAAAKEYKADVIAEIENSDFNRDVISSCISQAQSAGVYTDRNAFCECRGGDSISRCNTVL